MNNVGVKFLLDLDESGFEGGIQNAVKSVSTLGAGLVSLKFGISTLTDLGSTAVSMSVDFEQSFSKVSTLFGDVVVDTESLETQILNLSTSTGIAATELNEGLYSALSAGIPVTEDMAEAMSFLEQATKLSVAGFTSTEKAVDVATTVLNAYGLEVSDTERVMNTLIETQNAGKTTVDELASSIGKAIPTAASLGVNFEELSAAMATTTANGINTNESVTKLNALFREMDDNGSKVNKMFNELNGTSISEFLANGGSFIEVLTMINDALEDQNLKWGDVLTSAESVSAAQTLMKDGGESLADTYERMTDDTYELNSAYEDMQTTQQNIDKIQQGVNNTFIKLGDVIMDIASPAIELIAENIEWLAPIAFGLGATIAVLAVVFGVAAVAAGILSLGLVPLIASFIAAAAPVILLVLVIGVLVFAFIKAAEQAGVLGEILTIFSKIAAISFLLVGITLKLLGMVFKIVFEGIAKIIQKFLEFFGPEIEMISKILTLLTEFLYNVFIGDWEAAFATTQEIADVFVDWFSERFPTVYDTMSETVNLIQALADGDWAAAWESMKNIVVIYMDWFERKFPTIYDTMSNTTNLIQSLIDGDWNSAWENMKKIALNVIDILSDRMPLMSDVVTTVVSAVKSIIDTDWNAAWQTFKNIPIDMINSVISGLESGLNSILGGVSSFLSSMAGMANHIPGVNISAPSGGSVSLPRIPYFAKGGIVNGAGLGVIGEAGPEMILPLNSQGADFIQGLFPSKESGPGNIDITLNFGDLYGIQNADQIINEAVSIVDERIGKMIKRKG